MRVGLRIQGSPRHFFAGGEVAHEPLSFLRFDEMHVVFGGGAKLVGDELQLVDVIIAREEGFAAETLREDATHRPNVDCRRVLLA